MCENKIIIIIIKTIIIIVIIITIISFDFDSPKKYDNAIRNVW